MLKKRNVCLHVLRLSGRQAARQDTNGHVKELDDCFVSKSALVFFILRPQLPLSVPLPVGSAFCVCLYLCLRDSSWREFAFIVFWRLFVLDDYGVRLYVCVCVLGCRN